MSIYFIYLPIHLSACLSTYLSIHMYLSIYLFIYITNQKDTYIGITENEFKTRYNQHTSSFRLPHKKSTTTLSEHVWNRKNNNIEHCISWEIIENSHPYNTASKKCNLCTAEKYFILTGKPTLNKRREIFAQCPHRRKHLLQNIPGERHSTAESTAPLRIVGELSHLKHSVGPP